ncbi:VanW family protein [Patescibacteria group bacterium]|nr:VanW family protein [Patescibacteria group bacterium]
MAKAKKFSILKKNLLPIILSLLLFILIILTYQVFMQDKFYPLTYVGNMNISFLTKAQAQKAIEANFQKRAQDKLAFNYPQGIFTVDLATSSAALDYTPVYEASNNSHKNLCFFVFQKIKPEISLDLNKQLDAIALAVDIEPQNAQLIFDETPDKDATSSSRIQIKDGTDGLALDRDRIIKEVESFLLNQRYQNILPTKIVPPKVGLNQVTRAKIALESLEKDPIELVFEGNSWTLDTKQLLTLLDLQKGEGLLLDKDQTSLYLDTIARDIDQEVRGGLFEFNATTKKVSAFQPSQEGRKLDKDKTYQLITAALTNPAPKIIQLPVDIIKPKTQTQDVNSLGIKELLGKGISRFAGSIQNRIYNINLTASKLNGVLVAPGETFSFNQTIGDISADTGFKQAYVIKEGRTVLDDGGGVCQVSTTVFRAVLYAGLPVIKRTAHAYRVGYYEQGFPPGLDATVFHPSVDFQFKNDTPAHILIQAYTAGNTLYIDLYGTSDGRKVSLTKPVVADQTPPPPELRQDDLTLPRGTVKQVDWAAWGANVSFKRVVTRGGGTIINEIWRSAYKPWQAIYLVGTQD